MSVPMVPTAPKTIQPWIREVLASGPHEFHSLRRIIDDMAEAKGFSPGTENTFKKALQYLRWEGTAYSLRKGWWKLTETAEATDTNLKTRISKKQRIEE